MRNLVSWALVLLWLSSPAAAAETVRVAPDLVVRLEFSPEHWVLADQAPAFLLEETAEHLEHELEAQGKRATIEQLRRVAKKRLAANEAFLFNPESRAVLTIDVSPLREDEHPPGERSVAASARYAAQSLEQEEGVTAFDASVGRAELVGARHTFRVDASYRHHGEPKKFTGIIGFERPYWIFLYYSDPLRNPADGEAMSRILESLRLVPGAGK